MRALDIIVKKRNGLELSDDEIIFLIKSYTNGEIPDYQMSAFTMAVFFRKLSRKELSVLTTAMLHSGKVLNFSNLLGVPVDKHSTGGVGDKISIPLAPAVAACGVLVPMISGRGLGHTGGTLDKLESIPGFSCRFSSERLKKQIAEIGCCFGAANEEIAPADKKLYELRDVTGTVESIPLISSSIMSKKMAEGIKGLVLDVKYGSGAFMRDPKDAYELAQTMVEIGNSMGTITVARLTSMEQPIGNMVGHTLEIIESIEVLKNNGPADTTALVVELGAEMLVLGNQANNIEAGRSRIKQVLENGQALEKFTAIIKAQGGDINVINNYKLLPQAQKQTPILAQTSGFITEMNTFELGNANVLLGGGRQKTTDTIDTAVGIEMNVRIGDQVKTGQPLCILHSSGLGEKDASTLIQNAIKIDLESISPPPLFGPRITL